MLVNCQLLSEMKILNVEDEPQLSTQIARALRRANHEVDTASDGPSGLKLAMEDRYDIIVLDVNLPGFDGFDLLRRLRKASVPSRVIMLTARSEITDRVTGLKTGADDYLTKPFAMEELLARVEALGRRGSAAAASDVIKIHDLILDIRSRRLTRAGNPVQLTPREMEILHLLMAEPGRTFSRDEICERIWQREHEYDTRTVEIFIMRIRKKLDEGRSEPLIETVRSMGYRLRTA